jgi:hypothetical protein
MGDIRYQPHGQWRHLEADATGRDRVHGWLSVGYHVSGISRPGRVGHSDPQRPSTGSIWRPIAHVQLGEWTFFRLPSGQGRWSSNLELSNRDAMRLGVISPQHQTAMYETYNWKSYRRIRRQGT